MGKDSGPGVPSQTTQTMRREIPAFLRPFVQTQAEIGTRALMGLESGLTDGSAAGALIQPFDPLQEEAFELAIARARGAGGFIPTAQSQFLQTAQGMPISRFIDPAALTQFRDTASGDVFSAPGFQDSFEAALRRVRPAVTSRFELAGSGTGGLARVAHRQAAADAFARLASQERQRQLSAAGSLAELGNAERARQLTAAGALPGMAGVDVDFLRRVGAARRALAQRQLVAPLTAQETLLSAAGGGVPLASLLGQSSSGTSLTPQHSNPFAGAIGGGALGLAGGAALAPTVAPFLASLGGVGGVGTAAEVAALGAPFGPVGLGLGLGGLLLGGLLS